MAAPTYKRPGVFISELLTPLTQAAGSPGDSYAAFVGAHNQGPIAPTLITSWSQFLSYYGGFGTGQNMLPFSVFNYFSNGGHGCYVVRAAAPDAVAASITLKDRTTPTAVNLLTVSSIAPGTYGNALYVDVVDSTTGAGRFDFVVRFGGTADSYIVERYTDVSLNPVDSRYLVSMVNSPVAGSNYVKLANLFSGTWTLAQTPAAQVGTPLVSGADGSATPDLSAATQSLAAVDSGISLLVNLPGVSDPTVINSVLAWMAQYNRYFLVIDAPRATAGATPAASATATAAAYVAALPGGSGTPFSTTSQAAFYGPWVYVNDPISTVPGSVRLLPPGGAVLGQYALSDASRGVQKAPAGISTSLAGVLGTEVKFVSTDLDSLNVAGANVIRSVPGAGFCIMGARTLKPGNPDRYISVRRTLMYLKAALEDNTRFAIFEPNNNTLWSRIEAIVSQFLTTALSQGLLSGSTPEDAFFVICDDTNNSPQQVANGEVHLTVGVAINSPAEFIVIQIGQYENGSESTDTTATS